MPQAVLAFCTCPDAATASRIADALVGERLAACVSVLPGVQSVYRWPDAVERADEVQLLNKTVDARIDRNSVGEEQRVAVRLDLVGRRSFKKKQNKNNKYI